MEQVTIKDIARILNISASTVSRALKGSPEISQATIELVKETAKRLNYQPNKAALSLLHIKTRTIGVVVPNLGYSFFSLALQGIEEEASQRGYTVIASQSLESEEKEIRNIIDMKRIGVDGILISLAQYSSQLNHLMDVQSQMPVVLFDRVSDTIRSSKIYVNNLTGAFSAVEHLIKIGCKRIAYMGGPKGLLISNRRRDGYTMALFRHNRKIDESLIVHSEFDHNYAVKTALKLLKRKDRPDGIFAVSDRVAIGAIAAAKKLQLRIPQDVAIIGFNDEPIASLISPTLTSVKQPAFDMGKMAAQLLIDEIEYVGKYQHVSKSYPTKLMIRESTKKNNQKD
jgi:DNA-binding LacI/PurR family transcriptional regulator